MILRISAGVLIAILAGIFITLRGQDSSDTLHRVFTLQECIDTALRKSPALIKAQTNTTVASADVQAQISAILPRFSISSSYARNGPGRRLGVNPTAGAAVPFSSAFAPNGYTTGFTLSENILDPAAGGRIAQSVYTSRSVRQETRGQELNVVTNVTISYYNLVKDAKSFDVVRAAVAQSENQVALAKGRYANGSLSRADLLQAEVGLLQNRTQLNSAQNTLSDSERNLAVLIGVPGAISVDTAVRFPDTLIDLPPEGPLVAQALAANPGYRSAQLAASASRAGEIAAWLVKSPTLGISWSYWHFDSVFLASVVPGGNSTSWTYQVALTWVLLDGTFAESQIRRARALAQSSRADLTNTILTTKSSVRQAYAALVSARHNLSLAGPLHDQARENYDLTLERYRLGSASTLDVAASQLAYNQASQQATSAICDYYIARANLQQAIGTIEYQSRGR
jgi:outer membrane protein TolC